MHVLVAPTHVFEKGAFNRSVIATMSSLNRRPIIFPLSNPVRLSECEFREAVEWSNGSVIFASGSPFPEMPFNGRTLVPGQGNNMYIFPGMILIYCSPAFSDGVAFLSGLGLGAILSRATTVTDSMVEASAIGLANCLTPEEHELELVYPRIERIRDISADIAVQVIRASQKAVGCRRKIVALPYLTFSLTFVVNRESINLPT